MQVVYYKVIPTRLSTLYNPERIFWLLAVEEESINPYRWIGKDLQPDYKPEFSTFLD